MAMIANIAFQTGKKKDHSDGFNEEVEKVLGGLNITERRAKVREMGAAQIHQFFDQVGLPQYAQKFLDDGFSCANLLRSISRDYLRTQYNITDQDELDAIIERAGGLSRNVETFEFYDNFGNYLDDTMEGDSDAPKIDVLSDVIHGGELTWADKWGVPEQDKRNFTPEGDMAMAGGCDGFLFVWQTKPHFEKVTRCIPGHPTTLTDFVVDWDRNKVVCSGYDCQIKVLDVEKDKVDFGISNNSGFDVEQAFFSVDACFDSGKVVVGTGGGPVKIGDMETQLIVMVMKSHEDDVYSVHADWDEQLILSGSWDRTCKLFDMRTPKCAATMMGPKGVINRCAASFDKKLVIACAEEDGMRMWDWRKMSEELRILPGHVDGTNCISCDWDNMKAATGGEDGCVAFWDLEAGTRLFDWDCNHRQTLGIECDFKAGTLLTGSWDKKVRLWNIEDGTMIREYSEKMRRVITQVHMKPNVDSLNATEIKVPGSKATQPWVPITDGSKVYPTGHGEWVDKAYAWS